MMRRFVRSTIAHGLAQTGIAGSLGRLSGASDAPLILGYHRVLDDEAPVPSRGVPSMGIRASTLEGHLSVVSRRFRFVSLDEMGARIEAGTAAGLAAVTFDDGYADFCQNGFPLLQRMGIPAAVFVVTTLLDNSGGFLHDRVYLALDRAFQHAPASRIRALLAEQGFALFRLPDRAFAATRAVLRSLDQESLNRLCALLGAEFGEAEPAPRSLSWDEIIRMSRAGLTVGSHTRTHSLLTRESPARAMEETEVSRVELESRLGVRVSHFVYPDGAFDAATVRVVKTAGYRYAYTGCRHRDPDHPLLTLPRRVLWEGSTRGAFGHFSADVLSSHLNGIFDRSGRCSDDHSAPPSRAGKTVAMVAPSLDVPGGQSIQAASLTARLREDGSGVVFLATNPRFPPGLRWLRRVPYARTVLNQALYAWSLRHLRRADVVHVFSASYWSFLLGPAPAMLLARVLGKRVVLNYHSGEADEHLREWGALVHPWMRLAHRIVVPSDHLQRIFLEHGYRARVVPNIVDTSRFAFRDREPLRPRLLSTRTLEPDYQVHVVMDAFARIKAARADATLVIAGSGSEEATLRRMAEGLEGVTFLGRVRPERVPQICASADLFLNASIVDNQPLSLLEAFASGLPVVTTETGGIAAMVRDGECGVIVPPKDGAAMAAAVLALLRDDERAHRLARSARQVAENHSWPRVRELWHEVYAGSPATVAIGPSDAMTVGKERRC
jgi:glycosyltransferase involved in cell wall biosynthesis/peptidoglycan/xylan/chitin deacetylase (PgdA/CDA1 family)